MFGDDFVIMFVWFKDEWRVVEGFRIIGKYENLKIEL